MNAEPERYYLVPVRDFSGEVALIPAALKDQFAAQGILWTVARGPYPAGFSAPAIPKFKALMLNWPKEARAALMEQPLKEARLRLNESIEKFAGQVQYHAKETQEEEVLTCLHFLALLYEHFMPGRKLVARSWLEEALDKKREKKAGRFRKILPKSCVTIGCNGRYIVTDKIGNILTFTCNICKDSIRRKIKRKLVDGIVPDHGQSIKSTCIHHFKKMANRCCPRHTEECIFCYQKK